jgi:hypothetical protein
LSNKYNPISFGFGFPNYLPPKHLLEALQSVALNETFETHQYTRTKVILSNDCNMMSVLGAQCSCSCLALVLGAHARCSCLALILGAHARCSYSAKSKCSVLVFSWCSSTYRALSHNFSGTEVFIQKCLYF